MPNPAVFIVPMALLLPLAMTGAPPQPGTHRLAPETAEQEPAAFDQGRGTFRVYLDAREAQAQGQVRIEQRVVVRVAPRVRASRQDLLAQLPRAEEAVRLEERPMGKCLALERIAGVGTTSDNRLLLFMNDRRIVSARLEKACKSEDFYSGFYVERNEDGMLCVKRDELQSRAGAKCGVEKFRRLVAVSE